MATQRLVVVIWHPKWLSSPLLAIRRLEVTFPERKLPIKNAKRLSPGLHTFPEVAETLQFVIQLPLETTQRLTGGYSDIQRGHIDALRSNPAALKGYSDSQIGHLNTQIDYPYISRCHPGYQIGYPNTPRGYPDTPKAIKIKSLKCSLDATS